jgi:hypothetical protein
MNGRVALTNLWRRQLGLPGVLLFSVLLMSCAAGTSGETTALPGGSPASGLPPLPADRQADVLTPSTILGKDTDSRSYTGVTTSGNAAVISAPAGGLAWAIYRFVPGANPLQSLSVDSVAGTGSGLYLGLPNYARGIWQFSGPLAPPQLQGLVLASTNLSPGGNFYCLLVAFDGAGATVNQLTVTTDNPVTTFNVSGTVTSGGSALAGVTLTMSGQGTQLTAADGKFSFAAVPNGSYTLTPSLNGYSFTPPNRAITVSGANLAAQDFTASQGVTYTNTIAGLLTTSCVVCHGPDQAYSGVRLDTYALAKQNGSLANNAIKNNSMPFGGPPLSAEAKAQFQAWVSAGYPQ